VTFEKALPMALLIGMINDGLSKFCDDLLAIYLELPRR